MKIIMSCGEGVRPARIQKHSQPQIEQFGSLEGAEQIEPMPLIKVGSSPLAGKIIGVCGK